MDLASLFSQAVGRAAQVVETNDQVTNRAIRFVGAIQAHAFGTWSEVARTGARCTVRFKLVDDAHTHRCKADAAAACTVCRGPVCFDHGLFGTDGTVICRSCVEAARPTDDGRPQQSPRTDGGGTPSPKDRAALRRQHLRALGLRRPSTAAEVRAAYRRLAAKYHPDRVVDEQKKAAATARFVALGQAKDWLLADLEQKKE